MRKDFLHATKNVMGSSSRHWDSMISSGPLSIATAYPSHGYHGNLEMCVVLSKSYHLICWMNWFWPGVHDATIPHPPLSATRLAQRWKHSAKNCLDAADCNSGPKEKGVWNGMLCWSLRPHPYGASRKSSIAAITKSGISHWRLFILFLWTGFCRIFAHDTAKGLGNLSRKITQLYEMIVFGRTSTFDIKQASKSSKVWAPETGVCVFLSTAFRQYRLEKDIRPNKASASLQSDRLTKIWWLQGMSPWHPKPSLK